MDAEEIIDSNYNIKVESKPRTKRPFLKTYRPPVRQATKKKRWAWEISLFNTYKNDNEEILAQCFERDWNNSKLDALMKDQADKDEIKEFLKSQYRTELAGHMN